MDKKIKKTDSMDNKGTVKCGSTRSVNEEREREQLVEHQRGIEN